MCRARSWELLQEVMVMVMVMMMMSREERCRGPSTFD